MPLITGGALTALLARFGLRIPKSIERMLGMASRAASGDSFGLAAEAVRMASDFGGTGGAKVEKVRDGGYEWERRTSYGGDAGWAGGLMDVAKKFM